MDIQLGFTEFSGLVGFLKKSKRIFLSLFLSYFKLEDICFTVLSWFLPYIDTNHP